jgi:hypothetical protein
MVVGTIQNTTGGRKAHEVLGKPCGAEVNVAKKSLIGNLLGGKFQSENAPLCKCRKRALHAPGKG